MNTTSPGVATASSSTRKVAPLPNVRVAKQYGASDFGRFESLRTFSAGSQDIGKVGVDCKLRLSESRCGVVGQCCQPAAIMYMDLAFHQPVDCRLSKATVRITLEEYNAVKTSPVLPSMPPPYESLLSMTGDFGPGILCGPLKTEATSSQVHLTPFVEYAGLGFGGLGKTRNKISCEERRWTFGGHLVPPSGQERRNSRNGSYRTLQWDLEENSFETQALHSKAFQTAFVFEHDIVPFVLKVEVEGKLQKTRDRIRHFCFPQSRRRPDGVTRTLVDLTHHYPLYPPNCERLDQAAARAKVELTKRNVVHWAHQVDDVGNSVKSTVASTDLDQNLDEQGLPLHELGGYVDGYTYTSDNGLSLDYLRQAGLDILSPDSMERPQRGTDEEGKAQKDEPCFNPIGLQKSKAGTEDGTGSQPDLFKFIWGVLFIVRLAHTAGVSLLMNIFSHPVWRARQIEYKDNDANKNEDYWASDTSTGASSHTAVQPRQLTAPPNGGTTNGAIKFNELINVEVLPPRPLSSPQLNHRNSISNTASEAAKEWRLASPKSRKELLRTIRASILESNPEGSVLLSTPRRSNSGLKAGKGLRPGKFRRKWALAAPSRKPT